MMPFLDSLAMLVAGAVLLGIILGALLPVGAP
jgi:hypothetical protein